MADMVTWTILTSKRQYFIDKVKAPLMRSIIELARKYPEPTAENCIRPNSLVLIRIWDKILAREDNLGRDQLFRAVKKLDILASENKLGWWSLIKINNKKVIKVIRRLACRLIQS